MCRFSSFTIPATLAFFVITAHPEQPAAKATDRNRNLTAEQRNQQSTFQPGAIPDAEMKTAVKDVNKASTFMGMAVENLQNERVGTVKDLVFDPSSGKISYAVLSVGGFLGVGDKLVAVPITSLRAAPGEKHLVVNMTKAEAGNAPGLTRDNWPHLNDPALSAAPAAEASSTSSTGSAPSASVGSNSSSYQSSSAAKSSDSSAAPSASSGKDSGSSAPAATGSSTSSDSSTGPKDSAQTAPDSAKDSSSSDSSKK